MKPQLFVYQKLTVWINRYRIFDVDDEGDLGEILCLVEQKRAKIKEKMVFFKDESKSEISFVMHAEKVLDIHGKYFIVDADGNMIGYIQKDFNKSLLNSTWYIYDSNNTKLLKITESSTVHASLRRLVNFISLIPVIGEVAEIFMALFKYHFYIIDAQKDTLVGKYIKISILFDRYKLLMSDEDYNKFDHRLLVAMSVSLDALQSR